MPLMRINRFTAGFNDVAAEPDEGQRQIIQAYRKLTPEAASAMPRLALAAVLSYLNEELPDGGITPEHLDEDSRLRSRLTVGMLGSCQTALVICAGAPTTQLRDALPTVDHDSVRHAFESVADGANELGDAAGEGLVRLVGRAAPPVIDGLLRFASVPERLAHHAVTWYLLTLSLGMTGDVIDPEVQQGIAMVLPSPEPRLA